MTDHTKCDCAHCTIVRSLLEKVAGLVSDLNNSITEDHELHDNKGALLAYACESIAHYGLQHFIGTMLYQHYLDGVEAGEAADTVTAQLENIMQSAFEVGVANAREALELDDEPDDVPGAHDGKITHFATTRRDQ